MDEWVRIESAAFGGVPRPDARSTLERRLMPLDRVIGAFDGSTLVGAAASYAFDMTVPGRRARFRWPVSPRSASLGTHRRRGALRSMMEFQLEDTARRGEVAAILNASESNIYGRFGYGLAQQYQRVRFAPTASVFDPCTARARCSIGAEGERPPIACARSSTRTDARVPVRCRVPTCGGRACSVRSRRGRAAARSSSSSPTKVRTIPAAM